MISNKLALPILTALFQRGGMGTAQAAQTNSVYMSRLVAQGLVAEVDVVRSGKPGRPAKIYRLTDKARKRVRRALV